MPGWSTSRAFTDAINTAPCGCELAKEAQREEDPALKEELEEKAIEAQKNWACPVVDYPSVDRKDLPQENRVALRLIEQVIDAKLPSTCPRACLYREDVIHANNCYHQNQLGEMVAIYGPPTLILMEAMLVVAQGYCAKQKWDWDNPPPKEEK